MYGAAASVLNRAGLAGQVEDAVSTVVATLFKMRRSGQLTPKDDWAPYLRRAASNEALRIVAAHARVSPVPDDMPLADRTEGLDPVSDEATLRAMGGRLREAVNQLEPRQRRIVHGYYWQHRTDGELGEELGLTSQRVGQLRHSAERRLGQLLGGGER